jgi:hypothetical protein
MDAEYLDFRQLAQYSGLGASTLRAYTKRPKNPLPSYALPGKVLVRRDEFDAWIQQFRRDDSTLKQDVRTLLRRLAV